jgi:hypothetical protein
MFLIPVTQAVNLLLLEYGNTYLPSQYPNLYVSRHVIFILQDVCRNLMYFVVKKISLELFSR